jgi:hypothetical protein
MVNLHTDSVLLRCLCLIFNSFFLILVIAFLCYASSNTNKLSKRSLLGHCEYADVRFPQFYTFIFDIFDRIPWRIYRTINFFSFILSVAFQSGLNFTLFSFKLLKDTS